MRSQLQLGKEELKTPKNKLTGRSPKVSSGVKHKKTTKRARVESIQIDLDFEEEESPDVSKEEESTTKDNWDSEDSEPDVVSPQRGKSKGKSIPGKSLAPSIPKTFGGRKHPVRKGATKSTDAPQKRQKKQS